MSRIGNLPINIPAGVTVSIGENSLVHVKGPKGELEQQISPTISVEVKGEEVVLKRNNDEKQTKSYHGLYRSLINNMVLGVSSGYKKVLELEGVGYRATNQGNLLDLVLGYSHHYVIELPPEISVKTEQAKGKNPKIFLESIDKQLLGHVSAKIRSLRKPEPYKGKGIRFEGEVLRRKAGKAAKAK